MTPKLGFEKPPSERADRPPEVDVIRLADGRAAASEAVVAEGISRIIEGYRKSVASRLWTPEEALEIFRRYDPDTTFGPDDFLAY